MPLKTLGAREKRRLVVIAAHLEGRVFCVRLNRVKLNNNNNNNKLEKK